MRKISSKYDLKIKTQNKKEIPRQGIQNKIAYFSLMNISTALSFAALRTPVIVPPARPAAYARSMDGYFTLSGVLNVNEPNLHHSHETFLRKETTSMKFIHFLFFFFLKFCWDFMKSNPNIVHSRILIKYLLHIGLNISHIVLGKRFIYSVYLFQEFTKKFTAKKVDCSYYFLLPLHFLYLRPEKEKRFSYKLNFTPWRRARI